MSPICKEHQQSTPILDRHAASTVNNSTPSPVKEVLTPLSSTQSTMISPTRLYAARCMLSLRKSIQKGTLKKPHSAPVLIEDDNNKQKSKKRTSVPSPHRPKRFSPAILPKPVDLPYQPNNPIIPSDITDNISYSDYKLLLSELKLKATNSINVIEFCRSRKHLISVVWGIMSVLEVVGKVQINANTITFQKDQCIIDTFVTLYESNEIKPNLLVVPSYLTSTTSYSLSSDIVNSRRGVLQKKSSYFPFSVYPFYYDIPYSPGEDSEITKNRIQLENLPKHISKSIIDNHNTNLNAFIHEIADLPIWHKKLHIPKSIRQFTTVIIYDLLTKGELQFFEIVSSLIQLNELNTIDALLLTRFILITLQSYSIISSSPSSFSYLQVLTPSSKFKIAPQFEKAFNHCLENKIKTKYVEYKGITTNQKTALDILCEQLLCDSTISNSLLREQIDILFGKESYPSVDDVKEKLHLLCDKALNKYLSIKK